MLIKDVPRDSDGALPSFAWPGGYPIYYVVRDGGFLCPACANKRNGSIADEKSDDSQWWIIGADIHYEGPAQTCDQCGGVIESAYGDPDET